MDSITDKLNAAKDDLMSKGSELLSKGQDHLKTDTGSVNIGLVLSLVFILSVVYIAMYYHRQSKFSPYLLLDVTPTYSKSLQLIKSSNLLYGWN